MLKSIVWGVLFIVFGADAIAEESEYYLGGIQVNEPDHEKWVSSLKHHWMNTVSATVYANHGVWNSSELYFNQEDPGLVAEIKAAKAAGLKVVFIPRVALDSKFPENQNLWHGMIMPRTDEDLRVWFKNYQRYLFQWARVAEEEGVDVFGVGSELKALTHTVHAEAEAVMKEIKSFTDWYESYPEKVMLAAGSQDILKSHYEVVLATSEAYLEWAAETYYKADPFTSVTRVQERRALLYTLWEETIAGVREIFSGKLTYAANFDTYQNNSLWKLLDIMGINAYFQLRKDLSPLPSKELQDTLDQAWISNFHDIRQFKERNETPDQPLIFTELGYTYKENSSVEPWSYVGKSIVKSDGEPRLIEWSTQPHNFTERLYCLQALRHAVNQPANKFFRGFLYWKFTTLKRHEEIEPFAMHMAPETVDPAITTLKEMFVPTQRDKAEPEN